MKKVLFLAAFVVASVLGANAQAGFGLKAGANLANLKSSGEDSEDGKVKVGLHIGGFANVPLGTTFSFQPELVFSMEGAKAEQGDGKVNLSYINVPLMLQYNSSGFYGELGPQIGFLMGAKEEFGDEEEDVKDLLKKTSFSLGIGLGYKMPSGFGIGARYNLGLSEIDEDDNYGGVKSNVIQIGFSYSFGGGSAKK